MHPTFAHIRNSLTSFGPSKWLLVRGRYLFVHLLSSHCPPGLILRIYLHQSKHMGYPVSGKGMNQFIVDAISNASSPEQARSDPSPGPYVTRAI